MSTRISMKRKIYTYSYIVASKRYFLPFTPRKYFQFQKYHVADKKESPTDRPSWHMYDNF